MVSSYTPNKNLEKPGNGDYVDTWNVPLNGDMNIIDQAFGGTFGVSMTNANVTLTQTQCQNVTINITGLLSANVTLYFPAGVAGFWIVINNTTGAYNVTLASAGGAPGTTVVARQGFATFIWSDGSNVRYADDDRTQLTAGNGIQINNNNVVSLTTPVTVVNGGTGTTTSTGTGSVVLSANPTLTGAPTAPTAAAGTNTTQIATTAFVTTAVSAGIPTGVIVMWSGSVGSIPAGWALCNGGNGTPDLRDRFVVGAGGSYSVGATGGANSIILSTTEIPAHGHTYGGTTAGMNQNAVHSHSINDPGHAHTIPAGGSSNIGGLQGTGSGPQQGSPSTSVSGTNISINATNTDHGHNYGGTTDNAGGGGAHENRPPYYALCYIMKL